MKRLRRFPQRRTADEGGFTVIELLVYLMIASVIVASIYQLLIGQNRLYMKQRELTDVRSSLRAAAALLSWELRQAAAAEGDIYTIGPNSVALRSIQATGVICGEHETKIRYGLWGSSGEFGETADDSALIFAAGGFAGYVPDQWKVVKVDSVWPLQGHGIDYCAWGDTDIGKGKGSSTGKGSNCNSKSGCLQIEPDLRVHVTGDVDGVYIGAAFLAFRRVEYGLFLEGGRWWLGRKIGAAASYEKLTGPLGSPSDSGLVFVYYDRAGNTTAAADSVALVEIILRGESFGKVRKTVGDVSVQQDTLTTWVSLRG